MTSVQRASAYHHQPPTRNPSNTHMSRGTGFFFQKRRPCLKDSLVFQGEQSGSHKTLMFPFMKMADNYGRGVPVHYMYSRLSLSRSRRDPLKHCEISVLRHIRCAELRKIPKRTTKFHKCICNLTPLVRNIC